MRQTKVFLFSCLLVVLAACAPKTQVTQPPPPEPVIFQGSQEDVYTAVLRIISTDAGLPSYSSSPDGTTNNYERAPSGPWQIVDSDRAGGFISARTYSPAAGFVGSGNEPDMHQITAIVSGTSTQPPRTQVVLQPLGYARILAEKVTEQLAEQFERVN
jgi:hypothetical protein